MNIIGIKLIFIFRGKSMKMCEINKIQLTWSNIIRYSCRWSIEQPDKGKNGKVVTNKIVIYLPIKDVPSLSGFVSKTVTLCK